MAYSEPRSCTPILEPSPSPAVSAGHMAGPIIELQVKANALAITQGNERARLAKAIHDSRRARDKFFPANLFADPVWDMLLMLYWTGHTQQRVSVSSACIASAVPLTTALTWVGHLHGLGFVLREKNPLDRRVTWLELSDEARARLDRYFDGVLAKQASTTVRAAQPAFHYQ